MIIQVLRLNASSYQDSSFFIKEGNLIDSIGDVKYIHNITEIKPDLPFILISNTHTNPLEISKEICDNTIAMIHPNSGYDNFQVQFVQECNFPIIIGSPIRSHPVSEYILGCLFQHFVPISNEHHWNQQRKWDRLLLKDQNILIIGQGAVGNILSQSLSPVCNQVTTYDPYKDSQHLKTKRVESLESSFLEKQNVIIFAQSMNEGNKNQFGREFFDHLRSDTLIINPARGGLIIEKELERFLAHNPRAFAYLDVFQDEPYSPALFSKLANINKTSHIAGVHKNLNQDILDFEYKIVREVSNYYKEKRMEIFERDFFELTALSKIREGKFI
jgi:phosphoglycerate dehydrogenase-like enzyme